MFKAHPLFARIWVRASIDAPHPDWPVPTRVQASMADGVLTVEHDPNEQLRVAQQQIALVVENPKRLVDYNQALRQACIELEQTMHLLPQEGLAAASDADLWSYFDRHEQTHSVCARWGWTSVFAEKAMEAFSSAIRERLHRRLPPDADSGRLFALLMLSDVLNSAEQDQLEVLTLAHEMTADSTWADRVQALNAKTCFVGLLNGEPIKSLAQTMEDIERVRRRIPDIEKHMRETLAQREQDLAERERLLQTLGFTPSERLLIDAYRDALWLKGRRRRAQQYALYRLEPVLDELARRLGISVAALMYLLPEEIRDALLRHSPVPATVSARARGCRFHADTDGHRFELVGDQGFSSHEVESLMPTQLRGMTASRGYATGTTYVVTDTADMAGMPDKAILIIKHARPEYTELFARAAAVVCDQGGVTSHAAIIAREYGVPCVVATKQATRCFPTGTRVEVDANRAEIRVLC